MERLQKEFELKVRWIHFPLHPETPDEGRTLEQLFAGRGINVSAAQTRMAGLMAAEGLPYGDRTMTFNSRLAQEIAAWAVEETGNEAIHGALFRAYFVEGQNLADVSVLLSVIRSLGLPMDEAKDVLETRRFRAAVDRDWQRSAEQRVTGVPSFLAGLRWLEGAQPYEALKHLVTVAGAKPRLA